MIRLKEIEITPFGLQFLKYLAILLMVIDHTNKYLFNSTLLPFFYIGRLALPIFVFILSYNLARKNTSPEIFKRTFLRLIIFGSLAEIPFLLLDNLYFSFYPLNVMFTLAVLTLLLWQISAHNYFYAIICFIFGGAIGEYWWPALLLGISVFSYKKTPNIETLFLIIFSLYLLRFINHNNYALLSFPLIYFLALIKPLKTIILPRFKWIFYAFYPFHLFIFVLIRIPMRLSGYLFF